jgi:hypothetical protein
MPKIDTGVTSPKVEDARGKRWVTVPAKDLFDFPHPTVRVNLMEFPPGKHFVDAELADFIEDRLQLKLEADIRVMRPTQDFASQHAMNRFGTGSRVGQTLANPDAVLN